MAAPKEKSTAITAIVFDTETGGLDCQKCGVIQVSFHAVRLDTFEVMEKLNVYIKRYSRPADLGKPKRKVLKSKYDKEEEVTDIPMEYGAAAEKVHGITKEMQERLGIEPVEACQMMIDFIKRNTLANGKGTKPFFIGQNPIFDEGMIEQLFVIAGLWEELIKLVIRTFGGTSISPCLTPLLSLSSLLIMTHQSLHGNLKCRLKNSA